MIWLSLCDKKSLIHEVFSCKMALTNTGSARPLVSFWTSPISLFRTFLFPFLTAWTFAKTQQTLHISDMPTNKFKKELHEKKKKGFYFQVKSLHVSPHLIRVRVHHLLTDAVQLCSVANEAQVLLLDDLPGCLAWWPPHLLEHLTERINQEDASENQNTNKH